MELHLKVHQPLRDSGWSGYWIDAASTLRMENDSIIILDPVNRTVIDDALAEGKKILSVVTVPYP